MRLELSSTELSKTFELKKVAEPPKHTGSTTRPSGNDTPKPPKPKCQPPGSYNPFDTSCNGGPCPACKT